MNKTALAIVMTVLCCCMALVGHASTPKAQVVPLGDNTFSITRQATTGFDRDVERLKELAKQDAEKYCADQGKQLRIVSLTSQKPFFGTGYANAKIVFKAANPGDPVETAPGSASSSVTASTDELYAALVKLDDLRKKGILTEDEFQEEKKKVLRRSQ